jgi:LPXTG-motif cell wall-anchored protein
MSRFKAFALASCVGLFGAAFAPTTLNADQWNKRTILTVNEPIQVPNKVLQPGKYVMRLLDSPSNRHIVQIFDENEQRLVTTVLAIPNYRLQPTGDTQFGFWETPAGQPKALRSWFYPGDNFGQEFAYPKNEAMQIASVVGQRVPTTYAESESDLTSARVGTIDRVGTEQELDRETYTQTQQAQAREEQARQDRERQEQARQDQARQDRARQDMPTGTVAQQQPQQEQRTEMAQARTPQMDRGTQTDRYEADRARTPQELPRTGSNLPAIALFGLLAIGGFGAVTAYAKRSN